MTQSQVFVADTTKPNPPSALKVVQHLEVSITSPPCLCLNET